MKIWNINHPDPALVRHIADKCEVSSLAAAVLVSKGYRSPDEVVEKYNTDMLSDPFLIKDMKKAADIINDAIDHGLRICIYGDYDCDGVVATVILYSCLSECGADVFYYIPERSEGYGLNMAAIDRIAERKTDLIITVDNGISAINEAEYIYEKGMRLVVTDHHQQGEKLPRAEAVVDPHRHDCTSPFKLMCGAGIALKLVAALDGGDYTMALEQFGDLAAIATVADVVSLTEENRFLVTYGLERINNSDRPAIMSLIEVSGLTDKIIDSRSLAFGIAPRINAAGRFGSPKTAAELLLCEDFSDADDIAEKLDDLNNKRKAAEADIIDEIYDTLENSPQLMHNRVLFVCGKGWHHGVIGIVAARLLERFGKPVFIASEEDGEIRGSARSFGEFSIFGALTYAAEALEKFGGHPAAGGFTIKPGMTERFHELLEKYGAEFHKTMPYPALTADITLNRQLLNIDNIEGLDDLQPFGVGNEKPLFYVEGIVKFIKGLSNNKHTLIKCDISGESHDILKFGVSPDAIPLRSGELFKALVNLGINNRNGSRYLSIIAEEIIPAAIDQQKFFSAYSAFEAFMRGEDLPAGYYPVMFPGKNTVQKFYSGIPNGGIGFEELYIKIADERLNYCRFCVAAEAFREMGIIKISAKDNRIYKVSSSNLNKLSSAPVLLRLGSLIKK